MVTVLQTALEAGFVYAPVALALFLSFSILNIADMTTDGAFVLGSAVSAMMCLAGHPILAPVYSRQILINKLSTDFDFGSWI